MATPITKTENAKSTERSATKKPHSAHVGVSSNGHDAYVMPIVHMTMPANAVDTGFWAVLVGAAALGAIDLPLAVLIGAGVLIARHHHSN